MLIIISVIVISTILTVALVFNFFATYYAISLFDFLIALGLFITLF